MIELEIEPEWQTVGTEDYSMDVLTVKALTYNTAKIFCQKIVVKTIAHI